MIAWKTTGHGSNPGANSTVTPLEPLLASTGPYGVQFNFIFQPSGVFSTLWGKASELFYDLQHSLGAVQQVVRSSFCVPLLTKKNTLK